MTVRFKGVPRMLSGLVRRGNRTGVEDIVEPVGEPMVDSAAFCHNDQILKTYSKANHNNLPSTQFGVETAPCVVN